MQSILLHHTDKGVCDSRFCVHFKIKRPCTSSTASKVDTRHFVKSNMDGGFVNKDEATFKGVQQTSDSLVRAAYALSSMMPVIILKKNFFYS